MFCGECGTHNPDTNQFCKNCGKALKKTQAAGERLPFNPGTSPAAVSSHAPAPVPAQPVTGSAEKPSRNWLAIISLIVSLVSWLVYPIIIGFVGVVLGIFSLYSAKKNQSKIPITAIIAIIIGILAIVLNFFWLDIFPPPQILPPIMMGE